MRKAVLIPVLVFFVAIAMAQTDSLTVIDLTYELDEVVVKASKMIRKADMDVYFPSEEAVKHAKNGIQMLRNLMIPALTINELQGTISTSGQAVQLRINGREATVAQVKQLLPETIKRVEWIDTPGLRYNNAIAVLNFIVVNPMVGGSLMLDEMPALNCAFGSTDVSLKLNNGRSQWSANGYFKLLENVDIHREYYETFTRMDGSQLLRTEKPLGGQGSSSVGMWMLDYSYTKPDTTTIWFSVYASKQWPEKMIYEGLMSQNNNPSEILLRDATNSGGMTPGIRAYLEQHFTNQQLLAVDFNASLYDGHAAHDYSEKIGQNLLTDVHTHIKDHNQVYGLTADYIKNWEQSRLTLGISYNANRNRSTYENLGNTIFHQRQDNIYFYSEYFQRLDKVTLTGGLGAQFTTFRFRETGEGSYVWNLRPRFSATFRPTEISQFVLNLTSWQTAPSLSETNLAEQQIDGFQWNVGNPNLKTYSSYRLSLQYNYSLPRLSGSLGLHALTSPHAIAPFLSWDADRLVTSYENSNGHKCLTFFLAPNIELIPEWLTLSGSLEYRTEQMNGFEYSHRNNNVSGGGAVILSHWDFSLLAQYRKASKKLWGEKISWGESMSLLQLSYDWRNFELAVGAFYLYTNYDQGSKSLNRFNRNESHMRIDITPIPFIQLSYDLQWGRQKRSVRKLVNSDSRVQQSKATGR